VAHGVANRVDRLKAIGNGQVPEVVRTAWEVLTGKRLIERVNKKTKYKRMETKKGILI